jgi:hypothetical protein
MNPSLAGAFVAAVLAATWLLGRRRVPLVRDSDTSAVAALNRAQIALVQAGRDGSDSARSQPPLHPLASPASTPEASRPGAPALLTLQGRQGLAGAGLPMAARSVLIPPSVGGKAAYRAQLEARFRGDPSSRLATIQAAHQWGDRLTLPLLRRGLRDSDPAVVLAAAKAIERFRGRPTPAALRGPQRAPLPRNVARTR